MLSILKKTYSSSLDYIYELLKSIVLIKTSKIDLLDSLGKIREPVRITNTDMKCYSHPWEGLFCFLHIVFNIQYQADLGKNHNPTEFVQIEKTLKINVWKSKNLNQILKVYM